jgi:hypothetical protein
MLTKIISKLFKKKLFKCEVVLLKDDFVAEYETDSLKSALDWVLHGIYEARYTSQQADTDYDCKFSATKGVYGRIMPYKLLCFSEKSITLLGYKKPKPDDHVFMTDNMIHVPENILKKVKNEAIVEYFMSK